MLLEQLGLHAAVDRNVMESFITKLQLEQCLQLYVSVPQISFSITIYLLINASLEVNCFVKSAIPSNEAFETNDVVNND